ncbi:hypothetical protein CW304_00860 [Bacillus sp. UFRGS-B20]|nr:hypothetical protein CW304_00860 [Bacillus sp. UFRGS-B20]
MNIYYSYYQFITYITYLLFHFRFFSFLFSHLPHFHSLSLVHPSYLSLVFFSYFFRFFDVSSPTYCTQSLFVIDYRLVIYEYMLFFLVTHFTRLFLILKTNNKIFPSIPAWYSHNKFASSSLRPNSFIFLLS